ncbi:MAG TPA: hypothetical protein VK400_19565, partial [Pyrinomonadaceae bacterium]|nr:hypothetical protein [Pyrinomonadaceae bacterium]
NDGQGDGEKIIFTEHGFPPPQTFWPARKKSPLYRLFQSLADFYLFETIVKRNPECIILVSIGELNKLFVFGGKSLKLFAANGRFPPITKLKENGLEISF